MFYRDEFFTRRKESDHIFNDDERPKVLLKKLFLQYFKFLKFLIYSSLNLSLKRNIWKLIFARFQQRKTATKLGRYRTFPRVENLP